MVQMGAARNLLTPYFLRLKAMWFDRVLTAMTDGIMYVLLMSEYALQIRRTVSSVCFRLLLLDAQWSM